MTDEQKVAELLKPRVMVTAQVPFLKNKPDEILTAVDHNGQPSFGITTFQNQLYYFPLEDFEKWAACFRILQWWEERKVSEMPGFLKIGYKVYKIDHWERYFGLLPHEYCPAIDSDFRVKHHFDKGTPATEADYLQYISFKKIND